MYQIVELQGLLGNALIWVFFHLFRSHGERERPKIKFFSYRNYFLINVDETVMEPALQTVNVVVKVDKHLDLALQVCLRRYLLEFIVEIIV